LIFIFHSITILSMKPEIHVLIGMIASGKSSYCKEAAKVGCITMNDDAIVNLLHADEYTLYDEKLKILYKSIENNIVSLGLCLNRIVLIDRGVNVNEESRQRWIALARCFDVPCKAIVFPKETPEVHARRRFESSNRGHTYDYWLDVAKKHAYLYDEPKTDEGFDEVHHVKFEDIMKGSIILNA
jgi:predicted kinase